MAQLSFSRALHVEIRGETDAPVIPRETRNWRKRMQTRDQRGKSPHSISSPAGRSAQSFRLHDEMERRGRRGLRVQKSDRPAPGFRNSTHCRERKKKKETKITQRREIRKLNSQHENDRISKTKKMIPQIRSEWQDLPRKNREIQIAQQRERARGSHPNPLATTGLHFLANGRVINEESTDGAIEGTGGWNTNL